MNVFQRDLYIYEVLLSCWINIMKYIYVCSRKNFVFLFGTLINSTVRVDEFFHPIKMTHPLRPRPSFRAAQIGKSPLNTLFLTTFSTWTDIFTVHSPFSSSITPPWGKLSNLWNSWVDSLRPRVPSWIWIWWIQYATQRNPFKSPPSLALSTAPQNSAQTPSYFIPVQPFLETFTLLSPNNQDHTSMGDYIIPFLNQQTRHLLHLWRPYLSHTFNNALTLMMHISLGHLAAKHP